MTAERVVEERKRRGGGIREGRGYLIRVRILLIGLLILLDNLLRHKQTPHITDTAEVKGGLTLIVANLGIGASSKEDLHALSRASPGGLVKSGLTRLILDERVGATRDEKLACGGIAGGGGPVKSSLTKTVKLVDIDVLGLIVEVLLDEVILTSLSGSDETRGLCDLRATSSRCHYVSNSFRNEKK